MQTTIKGVRHSVRHHRRNYYEPSSKFQCYCTKRCKRLSRNLWQARKYISTAKKLISATALTPDDYDDQRDFQEAVVQRANVNFHFISITKYIDEMSEYTKGYMPPLKR